MVAERGMISQKRLTEIEEARLSYIIGTRRRKAKTLVEVLRLPGELPTGSRKPEG